MTDFMNTFEIYFILKTNTLETPFVRSTDAGPSQGRNVFVLEVHIKEMKTTRNALTPWHTPLAKHAVPVDTPSFGLGTRQSLHSRAT